MKKYFAAVLSTMVFAASGQAFAIYMDGDLYTDPAYSEGPGYTFKEWNFTYDFSEPGELDVTLSFRCDDGCPTGKDLWFNGYSMAGQTYTYAGANPDDLFYFRYFIFEIDPGWLAESNTAVLYTESNMQISGALLTVEGRGESPVVPGSSAAILLVLAAGMSLLFRVPASGQSHS